MKKTHFAAPMPVAIGCLLVLASLARAQDEADHAALRQMVAEYEEAVRKGEPALLQSYLAPGFTGVMVTGEQVESYDALVGYWERIQSLLGEGGKYTVKVNVPAPAVIVGDVAFAQGTTEDTAVTSDGKEYNFQGFWTAICRRDGDGWQIVRLHGSMDAIGNTFVTTMLRTASVSAAVVGGLVGFVIGAILFWFLGRRRSARVAA